MCIEKNNPRKCSRCKREKEISEFKENSVQCIECYQRSQNWRLKNLERYRQLQRNWCRINKIKASLSYKSWRIRNKDYDCFRVQMRYALQLKAIPKWADLESIKDFYRKRPEGFHVDHMVPLKSELVCGLHCEANLQYLLAGKNCGKRNYYWPDMPEISGGR